MYLLQIKRLTTIITTNRITVRTTPLPTPPTRAAYINKSQQKLQNLYVNRSSDLYVPNGNGCPVVSVIRIINTKEIIHTFYTYDYAEP